MLYPSHFHRSRENSIQLSSDILDSIFKWLQIDCESLNTCCQVSKQWCERGMQVLYSKPFDFLRSLGASEYSEEFQLEEEAVDISFRIQLLILTLVSDEYRRQYGNQIGYLNCLRQLDFLYIGYLWDEFSSTYGAYEKDKIQWSIFEVSRYSQRLEALVCDEFAFNKQLFSLSDEIQYSKLRRLEIHFSKSQPNILSSQNILDIGQCCRNLRVLHLRAKSTFTDTDLAFLIRRQRPNSFQELLIERSQETSFEQTLEALYVHHRNNLLVVRFIWCNQLGFLNELGAFPRLESLEITNCHRLTNEGLLTPEGSFKSLKHLTLRETAITSSKVVSLCKNSGETLQTLNISVDAQLQTELVRALVNYCPNLRNLGFSLLSFTLADLELLASKCVRLQRLKLGHPQESNPYLTEVTLCKVINIWKELQYLDLGHTAVTPLVIRHLGAKKALRQLKIDYAFQSNIFWTQVAIVLGERFAWDVHRNDLNIVTYRL
ncbi:UV-damaged DNA-binding protein rad7 [Basidiobolus ranarum]|uniref:UV-damaged DNA-binding protein rad7 n=1 Tax=Basidiobolus ranarum TaxID=34480 RepID=A0ABR2VML0_9FUNG